ncbi:DUF349 domain-containing protein [Vitellibacter sp. q18]|nr:DUF349 domain-containing protein [Aequorivita lutea]
MSDEKLPQDSSTPNPSPENGKEIPTPTDTNDTQPQAESGASETEEGKVHEATQGDSEKELVAETEKKADNDLLEDAMVEEKQSVQKADEKNPVTADADDAETVEDEEEVASSEDEEDEDDSTEASQRDYSSFSEKELVAELEKLLKTGKIQDIKHDVEEIRSEFNSKFNEALEHQKEEFLAEGGNIIDFQFTTPLKKQFNSLYFDYKEKRNNHYRNLKKDLQANLDKRWELIEALKGLLSAEENINTTYKHFKEIQEKWHLAGPIPRDKYNTVWNTYHHHVENFYDFLHLNREFRDLDFKHNLDSKLKLITRAEELTQEPDVNKAFRELQMLHKMWKEDIGPVAKEYRDEVWDKFSEATKIIHDKRQAQLAEMEKDFEANYETKKQLVESIKNITEGVKSSHQGWQDAMKKVQELRDAFFNTGRVPRANNKEIWKLFKDATGNFNRQKNNFYKNQKKEQYLNLEKKRELIKIAEENKDSDDFETTTGLMKKIQDDWKKIGHVPRKDSDKVWKQFKKACNHYFDRLHAQKNEANKEEVAHLETKQTMLQELAALELTGDHKADVKTIKEKIAAWKKVGRVPYNKRQIEQKFNQTLDALFSKLDLSKKETELIKFDNKLNTLVNRDDERKLQNEHFFISKKIDETKDEIRQLENNLGFFHHVDENNPLVKEVHKNIARHKEQLEVWKAKLSKIKEIRE